MVVIIPNLNDQLSLVKLQEQLCKTYCSQAEYLCKAFPLWIPIPDSDCITAKELKTFSKTIKAITILPPDENFHCCIRINFSDTEKTADLELLKSKGLKKIDSQELPPVSLKSFRIGIIKQNSTNTVSITDSVWVKL